MTLHRYTAWPIVSLIALAPLWIACSSDLGTPGGAGGSKDSSGGGSTSSGGSSSGAGGSSKATGGSSSGAGGSSSSSSSGGAGTATGDEPLLGGFTVTLTAAKPALDGQDAQDAITAFQGAVYGAQYPSITWETVLDEGGCKVLKKVAASCDPECDGNSLCVTDNNCVAYPKAMNLGDVTVDGIGPTFKAKSVLGSYSTGAKLEYPPCEQGATTKVTAAGSSDVEGFSVEGTCISTLEVTTEQFDMKDNTPLHLEWTAPPSGAPSVMKILMDISHHGGGTAKVECEVDDDGSVDVPASVVDKLMSYGKAGMPYVLFTRTAIGSTNLPAGRVEMRMVAPIEKPLSVPGVISCNPPTVPCPDGMTCQKDFSCK